MGTEASPIERTFIVKNKKGIHARPAAMIVRVTNQFSGEIYVEKDGERINGKSIMGLMMLAANQGAELRFIASGEGTETLFNDLKELFDGKFSEA